MILPPLADFEDLSARLGVTLDPESADGLRALALIDDASALVRAVAGISWTDPADATLLVAPPDLVGSITLASALRAYRNPTGAQQASVGDVSLSFGARGASAVTTAAVFLTRSEERQLRTLGGLSSAGSVGLTTDTLTGRELYYAPTEGDDIPLGPIPWE